MKRLEKFFDILGEIIAVLMVVIYIVALANAQVGFLSSVPVVEKIINIAIHYGSLLLVAVVGLEAMSKRNFLFQLIFIALLALIVVFLFFPDTYNSFIGMIGGN